ncbi:MAG: DUF4982 domain-containing protein [Bacteroidaceae bacterium]|nr:DUF4982 domain-containing protein [Bacteroidaceae bacterium]
MRKQTILIMVLAMTAALTASAQRKQCIDGDWKFLYGTDGNAAISNPSAADAWRSLDLPHDWSVETEAAQKAGGRVVGPFSTNSAGGYQTGFTVGGEGWYQKTLNVTANDLQGRVILYFEGVYYQSWVYVNGVEVNFCPYGYSSFRVDVTSRLHTGENNVVVKVQNLGNTTRWYGGSGIYRHVWLMKTQKVYLDEWDTFVQTSDNRNVSVTTLVHNEAATDAEGSVVVTIFDANGTKVAEGSNGFANVAAGTSVSANVELTVNGAQTWSPASPTLYTASVCIKDNEGHIVDMFQKHFGFRTLAFSATQGFLLNGVNTLLKGGCVHHDNGMLGAAAFDKAEVRKLRLIKALGYNAVRCSHNLPSEHFLDVCDSLGLMVIDECFDQWLLQKNNEDYHRYFATWSDRDITDMVRRDRNHPSVIMWSIGNEIPGRIEPEGQAAAARLRADVLQYDTTRPVTAAICGWDAGDAWNIASGNWDAQSDNAFKSLDVGGYNYMYDKYEYDHGRYPDRVMCGLESYPKNASENWDLVERLPYVVGDFVWTAMDYLGEAGIGAALPDAAPPFFAGWPWFNGHCGDLDLIGQKKPQSYYKDIVWREAPVTMAVVTTGSQWNWWGWQLEEQCWTYPGREGQNVSVNAYSRAPKVRLYLNDEVVGEGTPGNTFWCGFSLAYQPGTLRIVNLDNAGNEVAGEEFVLKTTGKATGVRFVYDDGNNTISDALNDLVYVTIELIDDDGNVVTSDSETRLNVTNIGAGELIGCCTGSPNDMESFRTTTPTVFRGRALAIVRSNGTAGTVELKAEMMEKPKDMSSIFFKNADFEEGNLTGWTVSNTDMIKYRGNSWNDPTLTNFLECFVGWTSASTLQNQSISQSTKVLPAGQYTLTFDYNGTFLNGGSHYQTNGTMSGVTASVGGQSNELKNIDGGSAQHASIQFTLNAPQAVTFLIQFAADTNADWFALDNVQVAYNGDFDFEHFYEDMSVSVPEFGGNNWVKVSGNASGGYTEAKLGSAIYNGSGLAFWSGSAPHDTDFFHQDITNLPPGRYGIAAFCAANLWSGSDNDRNHQPGTYLFAVTSSGTKVLTEVTTATYGLFSLVVELDKNETLTLGMCAASDNGNNWCYMSKPTLVKLDRTLNETATTAPQSGIHGDIVIDRSLYEGWNTLVLPFDVDETALKTQLGDDVQVIRMKGATENTLSFETVNDITANEPVLVKLSADRTNRVLRFDGVDIVADSNPHTGGESFDFVGTYIATTVDAGNYILGSGNSFKRAAGGNSIKAFRAYMLPHTAEAKAVIKFEIDDTPTSIDEVQSSKYKEQSALYDLLGRKVQSSSNSVQGLPAGIYVIDGIKYVIR